VEASEGKVDGTGLGLSICKEIVSGHGGTIEVKSKYGKGATFTIHIPTPKN
jgi:two-component system sensor histidine kinase ResE